MENINKPTAQLTGQDGNIFSLVAIAAKALKKAGLKEQADKMTSEVFDCGSYNEALKIITNYVEVE